MEKNEILYIMEEEYNKNIRGIELNYEQLSLKLQHTTEQFARSFDYELLPAKGIKEQVFRFIKRVIRKSTRFMLKPYADQMLKFQECICELEGMYLEKIREMEQGLKNHEEAIYNVTNAFNDNAHLTMQLSDSNAQIRQYLFGGEDSAFRAYSQAGEDVIVSFILRTLGEEKKGYSYLDIGCNKYKELNNTYHFYEKGMRGVLIDANPRFIQEIKEHRPEDTVLNIGIGEEKKEALRFYIVNGDGLSSFNKAVIKEAQKETPWLKIDQEIEVPVMTVNEVIDKYFQGVPTIVSLDIEGDELAILKSINMEKYRPMIYIVETIEYRERIDLNNKRMDIIEFMKTQNYREYAFTGVNSIFLDERQF